MEDPKSVGLTENYYKGNKDSYRVGYLAVRQLPYCVKNAIPVSPLSWYLAKLFQKKRKEENT